MTTSLVTITTTATTGGAIVSTHDADARLIDRFREYVRATSPSASDATVNTYTRGAAYVERYMHSIGKRLIDATRSDIRAYRTALESKGMSPSSVRLYLAATRRVFEWLAEESISTDVTAGLKIRIRTPEGHRRKQLAESDAGKVLELIDRSTVQGKRDYAIIRLMLTRGLRCVEICRADVGSIDIIDGEPFLRVRRKGKTAETPLKISRGALQAIREYIEARGGAQSDEPLFVSASNRNDGGRLTTRAVSGIVKNRLRDAGIDDPRITAHSLRHTAITAKARIVRETGNGTLADVQDFAGHSDPKVTMIYDHELDGIADSSADDIDARLFGV